MEAIGLHNFQANAQDELSFTKGEKLKIVSMKDSDPDWYKAEHMGRSYLVPSNYVKMEENSWYRGEMSRMEAEGELANKHQGAYVIRNSETGVPTDVQAVPPFSLSVKTTLGYEHFRIMSDEQGKYFLWTKKFEFINQLVHYHRTASVSRKTDVKLRDKYESPAAAPPQPMAPPGRRVPPPPSTPPVHRVQAMYEYVPDNPHDGVSLTMQVGDVITVIEKTDQDWWKGQLHNNTGFFPASFVKNC